MTSTQPSSSRIRKKMVHVVHQDGQGGGPVVVNQLIRDFSRQFELSAIVGGRGRIAAACEKAGLPVYSIAIDRLWKCGLGFFQLIGLLLKIRPDVIFLHGQWAGPLGAVAAKLGRVPVVIYVAHSPAFYHRQTFRNSVRSYVSEWIPCRFADAIVVLSKGNQYQYLIREWVEEEKFYLIHNGLDEAREPKTETGMEIRRRLQWNPNRRHVLFLGRLDRQKGAVWLLKAWQKVLRVQPESELWIVGNGPMETELKQLARELVLEEKCHFLPDQANGREFIAAADLVVLPSLYEGHALVPLETMAEGKAFFGTAVDGIVDSIRNGEEGLLVAPADIQGLALVLESGLENPSLCHELGGRGLERIKEFNWQFSFLRYEELVRTLLEKKAR